MNVYKIHNVKIDGLTYMCKYDKQTNQPMYKRKFSVSGGSLKKPKRLVTKNWESSIRKVNHEVESTRVFYRENYNDEINEVVENKHTYQSIVDEYYENEVQNCINHNSSFSAIEKFKQNNYKYVLNGNYNNFKKMYVEDITVHDVKQLKKDIITETMKHDLSILTVSHIFTNIDKALRYSAEKMYIDDTIVDNVRVEPKGKRRRKTTINNFLLKSEFDYLMQVFDTDFKFNKSENHKTTEFRKELYETYLICAFYLGFRKSEGFSLKWSDVTNDTISINTTLNTVGVTKHIKNVTSRIIDPKTESSIREMTLSKTVKERLAKWKLYCVEYGFTVNADDFIFRETNNCHLTPTTFTNRFNRIVDESGIKEKFDKHLYIHGFRHSCCSFLVQKLRESNDKMSLREIEIAVGQYLGHSSGKMVSEVYMHLYPDNEKSALNKILVDL